MKNRKTVVVPKTKRQIVTGIIVNEKINLTKEYKKNIRQQMFYIKKFGLEEHLKRLEITDAKKYLNSLKGKISHVLQTTPNDKEFLQYKSLLKTKC